MQTDVLTSHSGTHFTRDLLAYYWILVKIIIAVIMILMYQSEHKFAQVANWWNKCCPRKNIMIF